MNSAENIMMWVAWKMPKWLVYFCAIRLISYGTVGKYSDTDVTKLTATDALDRWGK